MRKIEAVILPDEVPPPCGANGKTEYKKYWEKSAKAHKRLEKMKEHLRKRSNSST